MRCDRLVVWSEARSPEVAGVWGVTMTMLRATTRGLMASLVQVYDGDQPALFFKTEILSCAHFSRNVGGNFRKRQIYACLVNEGISEFYSYQKL